MIAIPILLVLVKRILENKDVPRRRRDYTLAN